MSSRQRIEFIDLFRGIGILAMIMAHIGFGKWFDHYVHAFHMPMFFFVSGYFFTMKSARAFFFKKFKALLVPYVIYAVAIYGIWRLAFQSPNESIGHVLLYMNDSSFVAAALWFLTALFIANGLYWLARKWVANETIITVIVVCIALAGTLAHHIYAGAFPLALDAGMVGVGFMHIGFLLRNRQSKLACRLTHLSWLEILISFVCVSALIMVNKAVNMRVGEYGIIPLFWINATAMCITLWGLCIRILDAANESKILNCLTAPIMKIGARSLIFLSLNQVVIALFFCLFPIDNLSSILIFIHNVACLVVVISFLYPLAYIREKYSFLR